MRVPYSWGAVAAGFGLIEDDRDGYEGSREQWRAFRDYLNSLGRSELEPAQKGRVTHMLGLVGDAAY